MLEQYLEENMSSFNHEVVDNEGNQICITNSLDNILTKLDIVSDTLASKIENKILSDLDDFVCHDNIIKKKDFIDSKITQYIEEHTSTFKNDLELGFITSDMILDNVKLKLSMFQLGISLDDGCKLVSKYIDTNK